MPPLPRAAFARALRRLDRSALARFVAALWAARGWSTSVEDDRVTARDERTGAERVLLVLPPGPAGWRGRLRGLVRSVASGAAHGTATAHRSEAAVDAVVAVDGSDARRVADALDARPLDAGDLRELALYGIDRETGERLIRRHLDRPATVPADDPPVRNELGAGRAGGRAEASTETERGGAAWPRPLDAFRTTSAGPSPDRTASLAVGFLALVVVASALVAPLSVGPLTAVGVADGTGTAAGAGGDATGAAGTGPARPSESEPSSTTGRSEGDGDVGVNRSGWLAPGLSDEGIASPRAVASAHASTLRGRSYRWVLTYQQRAGYDVVGTAKEAVAVEGPTVYRSSLWRSGTLRDPETVPLSTEEAYADGTHRYVRTFGANGTTVRRQSLGPTSREGRYLDRASTLIAWYLSTPDSSIVDGHRYGGTPRYRVAIRGTLYGGVTNYSATAVIDDRGVVHRFRATYDRRGSDVSVLFTFRYMDVGGTTVERPAWHALATNATVTDNATTTGANATDATTVTDGESAPPV